MCRIHVRFEDNQVLRTAWRVTASKINLPTYLSYLARYVSGLIILLRKNLTIDPFMIYLPFASTALTCPSLLNVLVMPAIAVRYDI